MVAISRGSRHGSGLIADRETYQVAANLRQYCRSGISTRLAA
jgi:hypothetical protein